MMPETKMACPHCNHFWDVHKRCCEVCGCMWKEPRPPDPPPPTPTARGRLVADIEDVIWAELKHQADAPFGPYIDRSMDMVDASGAGLDMTAVAAAVADIFVDSHDDCSWCHNPRAVDGWGTP